MSSIFSLKSEHFLFQLIFIFLCFLIGSIKKSICTFYTLCRNIPMQIYYCQVCCFLYNHKQLSCQNFDHDVTFSQVSSNTSLVSFKLSLTFLKLFPTFQDEFPQDLYACASYKVPKPELHERFLLRHHTDSSTKFYFVSSLPHDACGLC